MENGFENTLILDIKNKELKKYIQYKLGKNNIELKDLQSIKEIIIDGKTITGMKNEIDFNEIDLFPNLERIEIYNTDITEKDIQKLKNIKSIKFRNCNIENLEVILNVRSLSLVSCIINNFNEIKKSNKIEELELIDLKISQFDFLKEFKKLKKLKIKNIMNFSLEKINFYLPIEYLSVENIEKIDINDIEKFINLKTLSVDREECNKWREKLEKIRSNGIEILLNDIYNY